MIFTRFFQAPAPKVPREGEEPVFFSSTPCHGESWKFLLFNRRYMDVSKNSGTPKSSILIGFSIVNHPFRGTSILGNTHIEYFTLDHLIATKNRGGGATFHWTRVFGEQHWPRLCSHRRHRGLQQIQGGHCG